MNYPIKTKRKRAAVNRAPLDDGDNIPNIAKAIVINIIHRICRPAPRRDDNSLAFLGGLNTSPCTNFQPVSSIVSSCEEK